VGTAEEPAALAQAYIFASELTAPTVASLAETFVETAELQARTNNAYQKWQSVKSVVEARIAKLVAENASLRNSLHDANNARNATGAQAEPTCARAETAGGGLRGGEPDELADDDDEDGDFEELYGRLERMRTELRTVRATIRSYRAELERLADRGQ
jgi:hypothetical protein